MTKTESRHNGERYAFDSKLLKEGFFQVDTEQDASYYGMWINLDSKKIIEFAEGDVYRFEFDSDEEMGQWVKEMSEKRWYRGIDGGGKEENIEKVRLWVEKYGIPNYK